MPWYREATFLRDSLEAEVLTSMVRRSGGIQRERERERGGIRGRRVDGGGVGAVAKLEL